VPWMPEDWMDWPVAEGIPTRGIDSHVRAAQQIACRLAGDSRGRVLQLTRKSDAASPELRAAFDRHESCDPSHDALDTLDPGFDVVVATDVFSPGELPSALRQLHHLLVEGGVMLLTVKARGRDEIPFPMIARPEEAWHELELQYCLRRAAFQGLRIRRMDADSGGQQFLVMAVRRALN
jgi:hypothetical protein